jgi:toluene monooxygenase system protein E
MAPSGRITVAAALQAADEMRKVHRVAYRMAELRRLRPDFGAGSRELWQTASAWQPTRRLVETLLATYDWGEAFTALNLCAKPVLDTLLMREAAEVARSRGDYLLREIFFSLHEDCLWHRAWSEALVKVALAARPENRAALGGWARRWLPRADEAAAALAPLLGPDGAAAAARASSGARAFLQEIGVLS